MNKRRLVISVTLSILLLLLSVAAFGIVVNAWHYPDRAPYWLEASTYFSFMWPFVVLMKILPRPLCDGSYDYDSCGANGLAYLFLIPILLISHSAFFYGCFSYAAKFRRKPYQSIKRDA
ncbi:MAG: hypothetical protein V4445_05230 [Pseudomonadota bacterium]